MTIISELKEKELNIKLSGRLDSTTASELEECLEKDLTSDVETLTIDLAEVDFISSKGLRVLVAAYHKLGGKGITLTGANASIQEVLRLSGLQKIFMIR